MCATALNCILSIHIATRPALTLTRAQTYPSPIVHLQLSTYHVMPIDFTPALGFQGAYVRIPGLSPGARQVRQKCSIWGITPMLGLRRGRVEPRPAGARAGELEAGDERPGLRWSQRTRLRSIDEQRANGEARRATLPQGIASVAASERATHGARQVCSPKENVRFRSAKQAKGQGDGASDPGAARPLEARVGKNDRVGRNPQSEGFADRKEQRKEGGTHLPRESRVRWSES